jgi:hypothetical protein
MSTVLPCRPRTSFLSVLTNLAFVKNKLRLHRVARGQAQVSVVQTYASKLYGSSRPNRLISTKTKDSSSLAPLGERGDRKAVGEGVEALAYFSLIPKSGVATASAVPTVGFSFMPCTPSAPRVVS